MSTDHDCLTWTLAWVVTGKLRDTDTLPSLTPPAFQVILDTLIFGWKMVGASMILESVFFGSDLKKKNHILLWGEVRGM